ncbi:MAG: hypothetical protein R3F46_14860 [bacterium]
MAAVRIMLICMLGLLALGATGCSGYVSVGLRDDDYWCDCPDYDYRHRHDAWWYWEDYDRDGVVNGRDRYPYDSWWW